MKLFNRSKRKHGPIPAGTIAKTFPNTLVAELPPLIEYEWHLQYVSDAGDLVDMHVITSGPSIHLTEYIPVGSLVRARWRLLVP
jgi:hypothetical protein